MRSYYPWRNVSESVREGNAEVENPERIGKRQFWYLIICQKTSLLSFYSPSSATLPRSHPSVALLLPSFLGFQVRFQTLNFNKALLRSFHTATQPAPLYSSSSMHLLSSQSCFLYRQFSTNQALPQVSIRISKLL